jgi:hypothetical protein
MDQFDDLALTYINSPGTPATTSRNAAFWIPAKWKLAKEKEKENWNEKRKRSVFLKRLYREQSKRRKFIYVDKGFFFPFFQM